MKIVSLSDIALTHAISMGLDSIFFEASSVCTFASPVAREAFRDRWLGSYLHLNKSSCFLALETTGSVAGYVVGDLEDPAPNPRYAHLGYFASFAPHTPRYPAHLHINIAPQHRSVGLGARLVQAFCEHAAAHNCPGVHVVTGQGLRNVGFYLRNGFTEIAEAPWNGRTVLMLGKKL